MNEATPGPIPTTPETEFHTPEQAEAMKSETVARLKADVFLEKNTVNDVAREPTFKELYLNGLEKSMAAAKSYQELVDHLTKLANASDSDKEEEQFLKNAAIQYLSVLTGTAAQLESLLEFNPEKQGIREYIHDALESYLTSDTIMNIFVDNLEGYAAKVSKQVIRKRVLQTGLHKDEFGDGKYTVARPEPIGEVDTTIGRDEESKPEPIGDMDTDPDANSEMTHAEATVPDTVRTIKSEPTEPIDEMPTTIDAPKGFTVDLSEKSAMTLDQLKAMMRGTVLSPQVKTFEDAKAAFRVYSAPYEQRNQVDQEMAEIAFDHLTTLERFEGAVDALKRRGMALWDETKIEAYLASTIKDPEILKRVKELALIRADEIWKDLSPEEKQAVEQDVTKRATEASSIDECLQILAESSEKVPSLKQAHDNLLKLKQNVAAQKSNFFALQPERHGQFQFRLDDAVLNKIQTPALKEIAEKMYLSYKDSELKAWVVELDQKRAELKRNLLRTLTDVAKPYIHRALGNKANPPTVYQKSEELAPQIEAAVEQLPIERYSGTDMERIQAMLSRDERLNNVKPTDTGSLEFARDDFSTISRSQEIMVLLNNVGKLFSNVN